MRNFMTTKDPLSAIKEVEKQATGLVAAAKQEVEDNVTAADLAGRASVEQVESKMTADLKKIETQAVATLKEIKEKIAKETDKEIKLLRSQAEPRQVKAVEKCVKKGTKTLSLGLTLPIGGRRIA